METHQLLQEEIEGACLGNFLSGMETNGYVSLSKSIAPLGNFLSGMETRRLARCRRPARCPWKLP